MFGSTSLDFLRTGVILYVLGFCYALLVLLRGREHSRPPFYTLMLAGFVTQSVGLYWRGLHAHAFPVGNAFELLQALAWMTVFLQLVLRVTLGLRLLGVFASGLAAGLGLVSLLMPSAVTPASGLVNPGNPWVEFHIALALFSYGVFGLLAVTAMMYLIQRHGLERKRFTGIFRLLPSLAELDQLNRQLIAVGVFALSISVGIGVLNWIGNPGGVSVGKLAITIAVWAGYLVVWWLRWRNRVVAGAYAWCCLALFSLAMFSLWPVSSAGHRPAPTAAASPVKPF